MVRLLYLVPILMSIIWLLYLKQRGLTVKQGAKGFAYIIGFNLIIALSLWLIMLLTQR